MNVAAQATERVEGIAASPGIGIAAAKSIHTKKILIPKTFIPPEAVDEEIARLDLAVEAARRQIQASIDALQQDKDNKDSAMHKNQRAILQTHLLLLGDVLLIDTTKETIAQKRINAEWALSQVADEFAAQLADAENDYLAERADDIGFVRTRILRNLVGHQDEIAQVLRSSDPCIIVTIDLSPAETAQMIGSDVRGFVTEKGTRTSHTAIMAQAMGIPAVVGIPGITEKVNPGDTVIVDGLDGQVIIRPDAETLARYEDRRARWQAVEQRLRSTRDQPSRTTDGRSVALKGNIELPAEAAFALDYGAEGIGLYRTEFLYLGRTDLPSRDEQVRVYSEVIHAVGDRQVVFRTFDLGADKMPRCLHLSGSRNPALGLRAIRLGLRKYPEVLDDQIKSIISATALCGQDTAWIMFPLVSGLSEFLEVKDTVRRCHEALAREMPDTQSVVVRVGCMIELPASVFVADALAAHADFFSIGTNDLIQYLLAIDRVNDDVAYLYTPYHPAALHALRTVYTAAQNAGIPVSICGGAAGEPHMTPLLVGLGYQELSVPPHAIPFIKAAVRSFSYSDAQQLVKEALTLSAADDIERLAVEFMAGRLDLELTV